MKNNMKNKKEKGYKRLEYNGIPVLIREWFPENKIGFYNDKKEEMTIIDIETGEVQIVRDADFCYKI